MEHLAIHFPTIKIGFDTQVNLINVSWKRLTNAPLVLCYLVQASYKERLIFIVTKKIPIKTVKKLPD